MPSKIQSENPLRLRGIFMTALVLAGGGYLGGVVHMRVNAATPQPCPAVSTLEHTER